MYALHHDLMENKLVQASMDGNVSLLHDYYDGSRCQSCHACMSCSNMTIGTNHAMYVCLTVYDHVESELMPASMDGNVLLFYNYCYDLGLFFFTI